MRSERIRLAVLAAAALITTSARAEQTIQRFTIDSGGGTSSAGAYSLSGTVGQADAGTLSGGTFSLAGGFWFGGTAVTGVIQDPPQAGGALTTGVSPASPNPARGRTVLSFRLGRPEVVRLEVYDVRGEHVRTLVREPRTAGSYQLVWDGRDDGGSEAASGLYLIRFAAGAHEAEQKLLLVR